MNQSSTTRVVILGAFPPQAQGVADYCAALAKALCTRFVVTGIGFSSMYPGLLYPGGKSAVDTTKTKPAAANLVVRHSLTYYNPITWIRAGLCSPTDVFHVQWWSLPLWPVFFVAMLLMRMRGKLVVMTIHNAAPHENSSLFLPAGRALCKLAHRMVIHSRNNRDKVLELYRVPDSRIYEAPPCIIENKVSLPSSGLSKQELGISENARVVLLYGALRAYKGIDILLRAFSVLADVEKRAHLVIAGRLWIDWSPYQAQIEEEDLSQRVHLFQNYIPENRVPFLFAATDIVVLPYTSFHAQSAVAATAISFGRPMVVSSVGGLPEWVDNDERWVVPPGDAQALADRLIDFFIHSVHQKAEFAAIAERSLKRFSDGNVADAYAHIYRSSTTESG